MSDQRITGKKAGDVAYSFLLRNGLTLVQRNYHCRYGEIDLIMQDTDTLVFIEVRYRSSTTFGTAAESVDRNKQRKLVFTANHYLQKPPTSQATRFDVVALSPQQTPEWVTNAFMEN